MRVRIAAIIFALFTTGGFKTLWATQPPAGADATAHDIFGRWQIFPGPNPQATDLLLDADPDVVFRIGHILFDYPPQEIDECVDQDTELSELQSVSEAVKKSTPGPEIAALIEQLLYEPHDFDFKRATVEYLGDAGFRWVITYELSPNKGGFGGVPYIYRSVLNCHGKLIPPTLTVFDAFFHSPEEGWTICLLPLPESPAPKDAPLDAERIRSLATESLVTETKNGAAAEAARNRMVFDRQEKIRIPVAADAMGTMIYVEIWAVNFRDSAHEESSGQRLTVWVTEEGRTSELKHLDHWWDSGEVSSTPEPLQGSVTDETALPTVR